MRQSTAETLQLGRRYLDLIGGRPMPVSEKKAFIAETVEAYDECIASHCEQHCQPKRI